MTLYDDLLRLLGNQIGEYPFLVAFAGTIVFCFILSQILNIFNAIFKYIGGIR